MQVHLSEQMQQFVQQHVDIGLYTDTAEVIRDALRQLMREQHLSRQNLHICCPAAVQALAVQNI
ncbi:MAG: type II toxin-antitoxin system ParD family antitoxin [Holosporales bacterium]|jgi:putative addiction module CopG family antidote